MKRLDCLGDMCPIPLMKLLLLRPELDRGESVTIVTDHSCTCASLQAYCRKQRLPVQIDEPIPGIWELRILPASRS